MSSEQIVLSQLDQVAGGAVVVIDVLRAFTTAAYAFNSGAESIYLVSTVGEALAFKAEHPGSLAMGEERFLRPEGFDFSNSPAAVDETDLEGRTMVQRTTAGTQGMLGAAGADHLWAASLVCASATAAAVNSVEASAVTYVISGFNPASTDPTGEDDRLTAALIERARLGQPVEIQATAAALHDTFEARRCRSLGSEDGGPRDVDLAADVDRFDFAMHARRDEKGLQLKAVSV